MFEFHEKIKPVSLPVQEGRTEYLFLKKRGLLIKRVFDLSISLVLSFIFIVTILPILALLINLGSKGPVFFVQARTGRNGKVFKCYKLRSMIVNAESDLYGVRKNDKRITKIGRIMRRYFLDELPQLFNVVRGDMSLVGPRPHMILHDIEYASLVDQYKLRQSVKPGITGLAQISGFHGSINHENDLQNRINADIKYIENWSLWLDISILIKTTNFFFKPHKK